LVYSWQLRHKQIVMSGKAWLVGVYTIEIDARIEELGYALTHVFATPEVVDSFTNAPDMVVFADDGVSDLSGMENLRHVFPTAIMISIQLSNTFLEECLSYNDRRTGEQSVARLLHQIYEREHRWDN
jgi:hypothetical protein